jgi:hypothetical protein
MPSSDLRDNRLRRERLFHDARFELVREPPPPTRPTDNFQPMNGRRLRLKHMVKLRHEPISDSETGTIALSKAD